MNTEQNANKKSKKLSWRKFFFVLLAFSLLYVVSFFSNSFCGGYWMVPEMDGRDKLNGFWDLHSAVMWQPRFGHEAIGNYDLLGILYKPLIHIDRAFIHKTIYLSDDKGFDVVTQLPVSEVHPQFRDDYVTKVTATALRDDTKRAIQCTLRLAGSARQRIVTEVWMPREMAQALGASPPEGFVEKPFGDYQKYFKEKYIRWMGKLSLPRDQDVVLAIPAKQPKAGIGKIRFQCDLNEKTEINHSILCWAKLGELSGSQAQ